MSKKRASRIYRLENPPPMKLTERDCETIKAINDYRVMLQDQVQRLLFQSKNTAQKRLWLLWQHQYLKRQFLLSLGGVQNSPILYLLDKRGVELLTSKYGYTKNELRYSKKNDLSLRFIDHTIGIGEIRISVEQSCRRNDYKLIQWHDEKHIKSDFDRVQIGRRNIPILPDAYFKISKSGVMLHFFLEYDRGSETLSFFKRKIRMYISYLKSKKCLDRYKTNKIRVLTITEQGRHFSSAKRLENIKKGTKSLGIHPWFWFSTRDAATENDFLKDEIWKQTQKAGLFSLVK